jgi:hypothetical protein
MNRSAVLFVLVAIVAAPAMAVDFGVRGGIVFDPLDAFVGIEALTPIQGRLFFNPNVEYVSADDDFVTLNADVHYDFDSGLRNRYLWAGAGLALVVGNGSDLGVNILAGIGIRTGRTIPYAQAKLLVADDTKLSLGAGIRF